MYTDPWYKGKLHVFSVFVPDQQNESGDRSWYGREVKFIDDRTWVSDQLFIDSEDVIDFTVVAVDPSSATQTLIDYYTIVAPGLDKAWETRDDMDSIPFPRGLPDSDLPVCGQVRAYGPNAWLRYLNGSDATPRVADTTLAKPEGT